MIYKLLLCLWFCPFGLSSGFEKQNRTRINIRLHWRYLACFLHKARFNLLVFGCFSKFLNCFGLVIVLDWYCRARRMVTCIRSVSRWLELKLKYLITSLFVLSTYAQGWMDIFLNPELAPRHATSRNMFLNAAPTARI